MIICSFKKTGQLQRKSILLVLHLSRLGGRGQQVHVGCPWGYTVYYFHVNLRLPWGFLTVTLVYRTSKTNRPESIFIDAQTTFTDYFRCGGAVGVRQALPEK